ncbi:divergent polysaccharide deacetylase family protein [Limoniibacter endophyticus]|uniref:Divergent polysaccharide deacetylase n=1 Tax=Limoniibacter endophyticus TaxID=1565040 RepID=A0A8J3DQD5_9HYPH|nr:divergent polysaccharide deacetylase family protein [Limoniibacter endophyticus]GHC73797.1 hypothetical protein GCM10010136_22190 [Limoniibacter endophyticus]
MKRVPVVGQGRRLVAMTANMLDKNSASDIDRPLGLGYDRRAEKRHFPLVDVVAACIGICLFIGAGIIALQPKPYVDMNIDVPGTVAMSEPVTEFLPSERHLPSVATPGPKIINVPPITGISPLSPGATSSGNFVVIRDPSDVKQDARVAHLPDQDLIEKSAVGPLPKRAEDGRRPFNVYAGAWSGSRGAKMALIIGGLSLSQTGTMRAIERLPAGVTLAFAPNGNSISRWMQSGRQKGHEVLMQLPMEPFDYPRVNPGPDTLLATDSEAENIEKLHRVLAKTTNYVGVIGYMGAHFTADETAMQPVMRELSARGLLYVDDGTSARSLASALGSQFMTPTATASVTIDAITERATILARLDELERTARATGSAIGIGSAYDVTVETVASFVQEAQRRGIELVPVSALANDPQSR